MKDNLKPYGIKSKLINYIKDNNVQFQGGNAVSDFTSAFRQWLGTQTRGSRGARRRRS